MSKPCRRFPGTQLPSARRHCSAHQAGIDPFIWILETVSKPQARCAPRWRGRPLCATSVRCSRFGNVYFRSASLRRRTVPACIQLPFLLLVVVRHVATANAPAHTIASTTSLHASVSAATSSFPHCNYCKIEEVRDVDGAGAVLPLVTGNPGLVAPKCREATTSHLFHRRHPIPEAPHSSCHFSCGSQCVSVNHQVIKSALRTGGRVAGCSAEFVVPADWRQRALRALAALTSKVYTDAFNEPGTLSGASGAMPQPLPGVSSNPPITVVAAAAVNASTQSMPLPVHSITCQVSQASWLVGI